MPSSLQETHDVLDRACRDGDLTLVPGLAANPALDGFLTTLPAQALVLRQVHLELDDRQQPASLVVSGALGDIWAVPGLEAEGLRTRTATVTYSQDGEDALVTVGLTVRATLAVGPGILNLTGSLGERASLRFEWSRQQGGKLSLADAATLATGGRAAYALPAGVPIFDSLSLTSCTVSFGFGAGATTTLEFGLDADPAGSWELVPGRHALRRIGVSFVATYRPSPAGLRPAFGGTVHATLDLGQEFDVVVGLQPGDRWEVDVLATKGLPTLTSLAAVVGAEEEVRTGLDAVGLGDITVKAVRLGFDRAAGKLAFVQVQGTLSLAGKDVDVHVRLPGFEFGGALSAATPIGLKPLLEYAFGDAGGLPDIAITELSLSAAPQAGYYALSLGVEDHGIAVGGYGLRAFGLDIDKHGGAVAGAISAAILVAGTEIVVTGSYGPGWEVTGQLDRLSLSALLDEALPDVGLPNRLVDLDVRNVTGTWNLSTGSFAFRGEADLEVELGPTTLATTFTLRVDSVVAGPQAQRVTSGRLTGSLVLGGMAFELGYDFKPGRQVLTGKWSADDGGFTELLAALGLDLPTFDLPLPDFSPTGMSFEVDWSTAARQAFSVTATTSIGAAFLVVDRPQPGGPWGFAFGVTLDAATRFSDIISSVGISNETFDLGAVDFVKLDKAFVLVSSARFPQLRVPGLLGPGTQQLQVNPGVSAGALLDLSGSEDRPDVTALRTLLSGRPARLLAEVTLSTDVSVIALTVRLEGGLTIPGAGGSSLTLADCSLVLKIQPVGVMLRGSIEFPAGDVTILASGLLDVSVTGLAAAFFIQGENGRALPIPMGFKGVHLTDLGIQIGVTLSPPAVEAGLLGRFVIGPGAPRPTGVAVPGRSLATVPPANEFVMIIGLEGEIPNPLLLSMRLEEVSVGEVVEALTDQRATNLPDVLTGIKATEVMLYWCDVPTGIMQPDGTWAYPGFGFNANLDLYGFAAHAGLKIDSTRGITGEACLDPIHLPGVIDLTGDGPGTPPAYQGRIVVRPGGARIHVSTLASPYLDISWRLTLFGAAHQSVNAWLTKSGFTFDVDATADGFSSLLRCTLRRWTHFEMAFTVQLDLDVDLGNVAGGRLGRIRLANTGFAASLVADVSSRFSLTVNGNFEFDRVRYAMPEISADVAFSSLADIPREIFRQVERETETIFKRLYQSAGMYVDLVRRGIVAGGDAVGNVLRTAYGQTAGQAASLLRNAGYAAGEVGNALKSAYNATADQAAGSLRDAGFAVGEIGAVLSNTYGTTADQAAQILKRAGYGVDDVGNTLRNVWGESADGVASALESAGYGLNEVGNFIENSFQLDPSQLEGVLERAGYAGNQIQDYFDSLGGSFARFFKKLDPTKW